MGLSRLASIYECNLKLYRASKPIFICFYNVNVNLLGPYAQVKSIHKFDISSNCSRSYMHGFRSSFEILQDPKIDSISTLLDQGDFEQDTHFPTQIYLIS